MSRRNKFASSASAAGARSRANITQSKHLRDLRHEQPQSNVSRLQSDYPLSADDIDEQIRSFFAKGPE